MRAWKGGGLQPAAARASFPTMRALAALLPLLLCSPATAQEAVHGGPVRALAFSGNALASAGFDQSMIVWDAAAGRARAVVIWAACQRQPVIATSDRSRSSPITSAIGDTAGMP